ncbi:MAG TPA: TA system VapC family ribonuclease toxin [Baekduia sp.]|uniref:TA system VapC family ribonuclease toxin n=1 Tax=Baekduia sp. TaxID=2600305 RepID=UPI002D78D1E6|nr:TA system VapC family ribonuclease toxin [Baekduia sp.]HET6506321.1 TA system VapC family ribonuclease toxin [Baekduia sp.]
MHILDVNALVALAWDSHVHHHVMRRWFRANAARGWATCPITESGFVRVSSNPKVLPHPISVDVAREVLLGLRQAETHRFVPDDVSLVDDDVPAIAGHRQVTDVHLLVLARRAEARLLTFDAGLAKLGGGDVTLLRAL